ncbi:hypothetical protein GCM10023184_21620 [Flaviaesturariibacter amylovorans]|uniref:Uncharacterized protein n=1 Tax=Flaviaesturariibacter amylovorans TaxID=1084520 RepID=A0ABP8GV78_9BACT
MAGQVVGKVVHTVKVFVKDKRKLYRKQTARLVTFLPAIPAPAPQQLYRSWDNRGARLWNPLMEKHLSTSRGNPSGLRRAGLFNSALPTKTAVPPTARCPFTGHFPTFVSFH